MGSCPLCGSSVTRFFHCDNRREYERCQNCWLVFVPPSFHLDAEQEKAQYDLHENNPYDPDYRQFLGRLFNPLSAVLKKGDRGLDFGSGPGPTLSVMLSEAGFDMSIYDVFYAPDATTLDQSYHFITATEVVEHLSQPGQVFDQLWKMLEPGGWLGLMTKLVQDEDAFAGWHYKNDPTHIAFFSKATFLWLGRRWSIEPQFIGADVVLFSKPQVKQVN